jgi:CBS domain-containing protein
MAGDHPSRVRLLRMLCDAAQRDELRRSRFTAADIMSTDPVTVDLSCSLGEVLKIFSTTRVRHVLVTSLATSHWKVVGILSDRDVLKALWKGREDLRQGIKDVATAQPSVVKARTQIGEVATRLLAGRFSAVPVVDDRGAPVGIVTSTDLIWLLKLLQIANTENTEQMLGHLMQEVERLATIGGLSEAEGAALRELVRANAGTTSTPTP